jgi:hypothetical protein
VLNEVSEVGEFSVEIFGVLIDMLGGRPRVRSKASTFDDRTVAPRPAPYMLARAFASMTVATRGLAAWVE